MEAPESLHGSARVHDRAGPEDALSATAARYWRQMAAGRIARTWKSACHSALAGRSTKGYGHRPDSGSARKEPPLDARGRMSPRHHQAGNEIQETGQSRKPGNKKARRCRQRTSKVRPLGGGVNLGFGVPPQRAHAGNGGGERGIRTPEGLLTLTRFPGVRLKPLIHLSGIRQYSSICGRCGKHDEKSPHAHATLPHMSRPSHHAPGPSPDTAGPEYPDTGACHAPVRVPACPVAGSPRPCQPK